MARTAWRRASPPTPAAHLLIRGSDVKAGNNLLLAADHDITVESAQNSGEQHSRSKSGSAAIGVAVNYGADGMAAGVTANASSAHGKGDGTDVTQRNSHLSVGGQHGHAHQRPRHHAGWRGAVGEQGDGGCGAGNTATLISGHDTTLDGAVLSANKVMADVGGR